MRLFRITLAVVLMLEVLAACTQAPPEGIRMALATMPSSLDPRFATDAASVRISRLLYQSLTRFDDQSRPQPSMASWQQLAPDHYRFRLLETRQAFANGRKPDADDVAATYRSILDPATASPHRGTLAHIARIEVLSEQLVDFHLSRADYLFPGYLAIGILPAAGLAMQQDFNLAPDGSGAFRFVARANDAQLTLRRRVDDTLVHFVHVPDPTVRALKMIRGEVDLLQNDLPAEIIAYLRDKPGLETITAPGITFAYLGFNFADPVTANPDFRRAVAHALDRASIVRYLFADNARAALSILPPAHWAGADLDATYGFDPEQARRLLRGMGFDRERPLAVEFKTSSDPFRLRVAAAMQAQLAEVGIEMSIRSYDWGTFFGDIKGGRFQLYSLAWVGVESPDIFRYVYHSDSWPPKGANRGRYRSEEADRLIDRAETAASPQQRIAAFKDLQRKVYEDLVYVPLWYEGHVAVQGERVSGYGLNASGDYDALAQVRLKAP